jgi:transposase
MAVYTEAFKRKMVQRLSGPNAVTATALSAETGVSQPTLSLWLRKACSVRAVAADKPGFSRPDLSPSTPALPPPPPRRPEDWGAEEKLRAVFEAGQLPADQLGAFLRQRGLHEAQIRQWREAAIGALGANAKKPAPVSAADRKRIRELEKQLRRKDKALAETAALLVLQKKAQAIWGDGDDDTEPETDK